MNGFSFLFLSFTICVVVCTCIRILNGTETVNLPELLSSIRIHFSNKQIYTPLTNFIETHKKNKLYEDSANAWIIRWTENTQRPINLQKLRSRSHAQHTPNIEKSHTSRVNCFISSFSLTFCCWSQCTLILIFCNEWITFRNVTTTLILRFI